MSFALFSVDFYFFYDALNIQMTVKIPLNQENQTLFEVQVSILSDDDAASLNQTLSYLLEHQYEEISLKLTYFKSDSKKEGGGYISYKGIFKYFREDTRCLVFQDGKEISVDDIEKFEI